MGQNVNYINNIERGKNQPSLYAFFDICQYLGVTPEEFFDDCNQNLYKLQQIMRAAGKLDDEAFACIAALVKQLGEK